MESGSAALFPNSATKGRRPMDKPISQASIAGHQTSPAYGLLAWVHLCENNQSSRHEKRAVATTADATRAKEKRK